MQTTLPKEIKWRGSTYIMDRIEHDSVHWYNPTSRHHDQCSIENWKKGVPYDRQVGSGQG